ncbi:MAG: hypothetical protein KKH92_08390 [Firmicutes bacterium]|nr:hypothetical protein [Bacillota bacterium]
MIRLKMKGYLHLYTEDVKRSKKFYHDVGFIILEDYSNEQGFCVQISKDTFIMILEKSHFQFFHPNLSLAKLDTHSSFFSLEVESKEEVDQLIEKVVKHGGMETDHAVDDEWVYYRSYKDIDMHQFEVFIFKSNLK